MKFTPTVEKKNGNWTTSTTKVDPNNFIFISAAAYMAQSAENDKTVYKKSNCDMLFKMNPNRAGWDIEISTNTEEAKEFKKYLLRKMKPNNFYQFK